MRPNHAGNKHPHGSKEAVKRLVVVDPVTQPHRKIGKSDVGCSLLATVPVTTVRRREKKKVWSGNLQILSFQQSTDKVMAIETDSKR